VARACGRCTLIFGFWGMYTLPSGRSHLAELARGTLHVELAQ